jgi:hypothetical protein
MNGIFKRPNVTNHLDSLKRYRTRGGPVGGRQFPSELDEVQTRIMQLHGQVKQTSADASADIRKAVSELETKMDLAGNKVLAIHSATASSWTQVKSQTVVTMHDHRDSLTRTLSHFPSR